MKTIRQIADDLGVTRQAIYQKIKKEPLSTALKPFTVNKGNSVYIDKRGIEMIQADFKSTVDSKRMSTVDTDVVILLRENLNILQGQLAEKDKQIAELTSAVKAQAQSINADRHNELAGTLKEQLANTPSEETHTDEFERANSEKDNISVEAVSAKRGFFNILKRRIK